ncbi:MAG: DUF3147 family protein [Chloroflexota bacterium]
MDGLQLLFRFILGGSIVVLATLIADSSKNPYITGLAICFPSILLASAVALLVAGHPTDFISRYFVGTLGGVFVAAIFAFTASVLIRSFGFWLGVGMALLV